MYSCPNLTDYIAIIILAKYCPWLYKTTVHSGVESKDIEEQEQPRNYKRCKLCEGAFPFRSGPFLKMMTFCAQ